MKINEISKIFGAEIQKASNNGKPVEKTEKGAKSDSLSVSKQAKELSSSGDAQVIAARLQALPDVRTEKIDEVREKIASGFYDSPEFNDKLADRLMKEFGFPS